MSRKGGDPECSYSCAVHIGAPRLGDAGRQVKVKLSDGGFLIADLIVVDARPDSLDFGIRDGHRIARLSEFKCWEWVI